MSTLHDPWFWLAAYAIINGMVMASLQEDTTGRGITAALVGLFTLPLAIGARLWMALQDAGHLQLRTFWRYVFNRRALVMTTEQLEALDRITEYHKKGNSLNERAWRAAARLVYRVNGYTAPGQSEGAKAIAAEIPQPEGRGIEAESAVQVIRHSPKPNET